MNFQILWNSTDITDTVINYGRTSDICTGVSVLKVAITEEQGFDTWDVIVVKEDGIKRGTFYIQDINTYPSGRVTLACQDGSLRLQQTFITKMWTLDYISFAKTWIINFLDEAGVSYNFTAGGNGGILATNSSFGMDTAYNLLFPMLQRSGWYLYFDANNVAQIGELDYDTTSYADSFDDTEIIEITITKDDRMVRNKAVVWGGVDLATGNWIAAEGSVKRGWQTSSSDKRTIVVSSNHIKTYGDAYATVSKLLNEFSTVFVKKEVLLTGFRNISLGDTVYINSSEYVGDGLVTDIEATINKQGGTTKLILDRRCPRLYGFASFSGYVYVGTWGGGVYRKPFETTTFSSYSSGLSGDDLYIEDLYVNYGLLSIVTKAGNAFYCLPSVGTWNEISISEEVFIAEDDIEYTSENVKAIACSIDNENNIYILYSHTEENISWVLIYNAGTNEKEIFLVTTAETKEVVSYDVETIADKLLIHGGVDVDSSIELSYSGRANAPRLSFGNSIHTNWEDQVGTTVFDSGWGIDQGYSTARYDKYFFRRFVTGAVSRYNWRTDTSSSFNVGNPYNFVCISENALIAIAKETRENEYGANVDVFVFYLITFSPAFFTEIAVIWATSGWESLQSRGYEVLKNGSVAFAYTRHRSDIWLNYTKLRGGIVTMTGYTEHPMPSAEEYNGGIPPWDHVFDSSVIKLTEDNKVLMYYLSYVAGVYDNYIGWLEISKSELLSCAYEQDWITYHGGGILGSCHENTTTTSALGVICDNNGVWKIIDKDLNTLYTETGNEGIDIYTGSIKDCFYGEKGVWLKEPYTNSITILGGTRPFTSYPAELQSADSVLRLCDDGDGGVIYSTTLSGSNVVNKIVPGGQVKTLIPNISGSLISFYGKTIHTQDNYGDFDNRMFFSQIPFTVGTYSVLEEASRSTAEMEFATIIDTANPNKIEAPPVASFTFPPNGNSSTVYTEDSSFSGATETISDMRIYTTSGTELTDRVGYIEGKSLKSIDINFEEESKILYTNDNILGKLEITNFGESPFMFVSTSGSSPQFFQKNINESMFVENSNGLPENKITNIRVDDRF